MCAGRRGMGKKAGSQDQVPFSSNLVRLQKVCEWIFICLSDPISVFLWFSRHDGKRSLKHVSHPQDTVEKFKEEEALLLWERYGLHLWVQTEVCESEMVACVCMCVLTSGTAILRSVSFSGECKRLEQCVICSLNNVLYESLYIQSHTHTYPTPHTHTFIQ